MFVFQGRIPIERRGSHYVTLPFEQYFWISTNRGPANLVEENEKIGMYDFPMHDLHSGTKRKSILFFHRSTMQMATSTILTWRHTSPLYKPFTCISVLKPLCPSIRIQIPQTDTSIKRYPLGEHFINSLFVSMYRKLMMSPLAMFLTSGELVTTYDRKGSGDRSGGQLKHGG